MSWEKKRVETMAKSPPTGSGKEVFYPVLGFRN
jgi:hypothetical protein